MTRGTAVLQGGSLSASSGPAAWPPSLYSTENCRRALLALGVTKLQGDCGGSTLQAARFPRERPDGHPGVLRGTQARGLKSRPRPLLPSLALGTDVSTPPSPWGCSQLRIPTGLSLLLSRVAPGAGGGGWRWPPDPGLRDDRPGRTAQVCFPLVLISVFFIAKPGVLACDFEPPLCRESKWGLTGVRELPQTVLLGEAAPPRQGPLPWAAPCSAEVVSKVSRGFEGAQRPATSSDLVGDRVPGGKSGREGTPVVSSGGEGCRTKKGHFPQRE